MPMIFEPHWWCNG